jgi:hypothetical protein
MEGQGYGRPGQKRQRLVRLHLRMRMRALVASVLMLSRSAAQALERKGRVPLLQGAVYGQI